MQDLLIWHYPQQACKSVEVDIVSPVIRCKKENMEFRTIVDIEDPGFRIGACEEMLFVGSCFADKIGARFTDEKFRTIVNPFGVMYNPASILHTIQKLSTVRSSSAGLQGKNVQCSLLSRLRNHQR